MKVEYAISLAEFRSWQPQFTMRAVRNAGFQAAMVFCALLVFLGADLGAQGYGFQTGAFFVGLGVLAAAASYFLDHRSVRNAKIRYERGISLAYERVHCRDQRFVGAEEGGFTLSCRCGTVARPWTELTRFSEGKTLFFLGSNLDGVIVPKAAFSTEGEITEFRRLVIDKLNQNRPATSRPLDFAPTPDDYREAYVLHLTRAGGWRVVLRNLGKQVVFAYVAFVIWTYAVPGSGPALGLVLAAAFLGANFFRVSLMQSRRHGGTLRLYFSEDGLYSVGPGKLAWSPWNHFAGYLENSQVFLIYHNPRVYRIIPKRALASRGDEMRALLAANLPRFDYRNPFLGRAVLTGSTPQVS